MFRCALSDAISRSGHIHRKTFLITILLTSEIYKDAWEVNREVLLTLGDYKSWRFVSRILKEKKVLGTMLVWNDAVPVLDLGAVASVGVLAHVAPRR